MSITQGCEIRLAWYLYILKKMAIGKITRRACSPLIPDMNAYLRAMSTQCISDRINRYFYTYY